MKLQIIQPRPELKPYVTKFWSFENDSGLINHGSLIAPNAKANIIIPFKNILTMHCTGTNVSGHSLTGTINMRILIFIISSLTTLTLFGQNATGGNLVFWSSTRRLTVDDFGIKTRDNETHPSFAQFSVDYQVGGLDFMTKNFNKKVRNYLIKSASTIDTTSDVAVSLRYQQTLFDICEIYTRQFRKALKENRKKIASGTQFIYGLNQKAMTDFANRRVQYDRETNFGTILEKQVEWENTIKKELNDLSEFSNE